MDLSLFRSRLFRAFGTGLRAGGLTGRRAVALAAPLWRGYSLLIQDTGRIAPAKQRDLSWNYEQPSDQRGKAKRPPPGQGAPAEAHANSVE